MVEFDIDSMSKLPTVQTKQREILSLLRNPTTGKSLVLEDGAMVDPITGESFEIRNGIPVILRKDDVFGNNRKQQIAYNWFSYAYDLMYALPLPNLQQWLDELAEIMMVESGDRVLETSVGTGQQFRNFAQRGVEAHFFGNDISYGMLNKCRKNLEKWNIDIGLVQGNAEALPFESELFDVVFHVGGFNLFNDKQAAIDEMIRVAKPGANVYIVDESSEFINLPEVVVRLIPERAIRVADPPIHLVSNKMHDIGSMEIANGKFWMVSFRKPSK